MIGLYIHIPFCVKKCRYCDFTSFSDRQKDMARYCERLTQEIKRRASMAFDTAFIGGGTPSCLDAALLGGVLDHVHLADGCEATCEVNPGAVSEDFLRKLRAHGFNRLSMGMQAAQPELLKVLGRIHAPEDVDKTVDMARRCGFENINVDLMFGVPTQTVTDVRESVEKVIALGATHVSCYGLIVEDGTPLERDISSGVLALPDEDVEREMYETARKLLSSAGFMQYEISNFAKKGFECRHNMGYWHQTPYVGVGLSAHGMTVENDVEIRVYNTDKLDDYLKGVTEIGREEVSGRDRQFETLMLGLRVTKGVSLSAFKQMHGVTIEDAFGNKISKLVTQGLLETTDGFLKLTRKGMDVQNKVLVELMD